MRIIDFSWYYDLHYCVKIFNVEREPENENEIKKKKERWKTNCVCSFPYCLV